MKHLAGSSLLFAIVLAVADIYAGDSTSVKKTNVGGRIKFSGTCGTAGRRRVSTTDISGHMRRLEEELEEIDEKLSRINPDGKTALNFRHKREVASLKLIQMIQLEMLDSKRSSNGKYRKMRLLLVNESKILEDTAKKIKGFPLAGKMAEFRKGLQDIRSGKEKFNGRIARSDSALLQDIHKEQRKLLEEFHKKEQKNFKKK